MIYDKELKEEYSITIMKAMVMYLESTKSRIEEEGGVATIEEVVNKLKVYINKHDRNI